jgi:hypothetical protein
VVTWRAFIIGVLFVAGISLLEPWMSFAKGWGGFSATAFPGGAVLVLVILTLGANVLLKLVRRGWELARAELMLVWCMIIVGATFSGDAFARFWYSFIAAPPYLAQRPDVAWADGGALTYAPPGLVLSKNPWSTAATLYFEGRASRVPWSYWITPLAHWAVFFLLLYLAIFFLFAILRRQWVESERLMFPLARVPLEFSEGSAGGGLLPPLVKRRGFVLGAIFTLALRLLMASPLFFGAQNRMALSLPMQDILSGTPLAPMGFENIDLWPEAVGFAFLVPADVSLSIWFFYFFSRAELQVLYWVGRGDLGSTYGPLQQWQQAGAYIAFTLGMLFMARRHLIAVAGRALGLRKLDDAREPVRYRVAFFGLLLSVAGCLAWYVYHGMRVGTAAAIFALLMCWYLVYARAVAQAGLYVARTVWRLPEFVHGISGGTAFSPPGAVIATMQDTLLLTGGTAFLAPMAANAFRIGEVFKEGRRRLLVPVMMCAFLIAMVCSTWTALNTAYHLGGANYGDTWAQTSEAKARWDVAQSIITQPNQLAQTHLGSLSIGLFGMSFLMFMRARFYWWPVASIGLLSCSSWHANRLWLPFLLGWMFKVGILKLGGGRTLRHARDFFIALIIVEATMDIVSSLVRLATGGAVPGF